MNTTNKIIARLTEEIYGEEWKVSEFTAGPDKGEIEFVARLEGVDFLARRIKDNKTEIYTCLFQLVKDFLECNEHDNVIADKVVERYSDEEDGVNRIDLTYDRLSDYIVTGIR